MKLQTLKPRLKSASPGRILPAASPQVAQRLRGSAGVADRIRIRTRDCGLCQVCKRPGYLVDHIKPLCEGGSDEDSNKQLLCKPCHDDKSAREAAARAGSHR
ncbi:HNH endonuclease [Massilia sp. P8910]|uniref:HNH endonuclease n=1 Tax=Massilia antarctica TaxID=2765360 RepID=UPI001E48F298|nr:HNH endonuclease signature motif containing protein [Massilia antarctica]MCE3605833.1 HNH endonuclease [Massilia antarctica]